MAIPDVSTTPIYEGELQDVDSMSEVTHVRVVTATGSGSENVPIDEFTLPASQINNDSGVAGATTKDALNALNAAKAADNSVVHSTGNETVAGVKTFQSSPIVPNPTTSTQADNKGSRDAAISEEATLRGNADTAINAKLSATLPVADFYARWLADTGTQFDVDMAMQAYEKMKANDPNTVFVFMPHVASKIRTSGVNKYMNKMYSLKSATYDAAQPVEATQPFVGGYIAPNEKRSWKAVQRQTQTGMVSFNAVSYLATDSWTLTAVVEVDTKESHRFALGASASLGVNVTQVFLTNGINQQWNMLANTEAGRTYVIEFRYNNGAMVATIDGKPAVVTQGLGAISFDRISASSSSNFKGQIYAILLMNGVKSAYQSELDYKLLSTFFPDVETVGIGYQKWTTSNFECVVVGDGTVIPEVQSAETAADATNIYNSVYAATTGSAAVKDLAATKAAAGWCYYNNDPANGAVYGKLYNWYAVHLFDIYTAIRGYRVNSKLDTDQLITVNGGAIVAGKKLKAKFGGYDNTNASNESGFSAIPSGYRNELGVFTGATTTERFWTSTANDATTAYAVSIVDTDALASSVTLNKTMMLSLRLLANAPNIPDTSEIQTNWITTNFASGTANVDLTIPFGCIVDFVRVLSRTGITSMQGVLYTGAGVAKETLFSGATVVAGTPIELNTRVNQSIQQTNGFVRFNGVKADTGGLMMIVVGLKRAYNTEML